MADYLLKEDGGKIALEDGSGFLLIRPGGAAINDGDEVMVLTAPNGIPCSVAISASIGVRVLTSSAIQIHVLTEGGTPIKVTI